MYIRQGDQVTLENKATGTSLKPIHERFRYLTLSHIVVVKKQALQGKIKQYVHQTVNIRLTYNGHIQSSGTSGDLFLHMSKLLHVNYGGYECQAIEDTCDI